MKSFKNFLLEKVDKNVDKNKKTDLKSEISRRRTAQDNFQRNVYKDLDIDGGELQGNPTNTTNTNTNKVTTNKTNVNLTKRPNIRNPIYKNNLDLYRQHQAEYKALNINKNKVNTNFNKNTIINVKPGEIAKELKKVDEVIPDLPGTNTTVKGSNTYVNPNRSRITTDLNTRISSTGRTIKDLTRERGVDQLLDKINKPEVTTGGTGKVNTPDADKILNNKSNLNVNKNVTKITTNLKKPNKFRDFLDRMFKATGVKTQSKYKSKFLTPNKNVSLGVDSKKVLSNVGKNALRSKILRGLGRFAGGVYAGKDFYDKQKEERIKGRSKTSQIVGGLSKALGGYVGGAIGATAGTLAGGGIGSFALGTGGAITGYNIGSRIGDQLYKTGRQYATGERKLNLGKTFKNLRNDVNANVNKLKNKFK